MSEPAILDTSNPFPFDRELADEVQRLVGRLDATQRAWLSGYLLGTVGPAAGTLPAAAPDARPTATILYGSQSGNSESLAKRLAGSLTAAGVSNITLDMLDCRKTHLDDAQHLFVIVSTHGEGDPPDSARPLHDLLHGRKGPKLPHLKYAVLALGDSSYEQFCETGRQFDAQLEALGAQRLRDRVECDVDFEQPAGEWIAATVAGLASSPAANLRAVPTARPSASVATAYTRKNPWLAPVLANVRLTARNSTKDVRHIELSTEGTGIHYEPGDALGVVPRNHDAEVDAVLGQLPFDGDAIVSVNGADSPFRAALSDHFDIGPLTRPLVERYATLTGHAGLLDPAELATFEAKPQPRHLVDLLVAHPPGDIDARQFAAILRPLAPRLYSIASSAKATPDEVHLTVRVVEYEAGGRGHRGVVSGALADATGEDALVAVYPHRNPAFRLPASPDAPVIMIGPGTGVAPFRAFLAEREVVGARGRNWLFFGDRTLRSDFLYQTELLAWRASGVLDRLDVAFSRDHGAKVAGKVYVQQRIREQGADVYAWLREGAHVYVCGDAVQMAPDVHAALHEVIRTHGGLDADGADEFLLELQRERRYQKDVY